MESYAACRGLSLPPILSNTSSSCYSSPSPTKTSRLRSPMRSPKKSPKKSPKRATHAVAPAHETGQTSIHVIIKPTTPGYTPSSLQSHSSKNVVFDQQYFSFPSTVLTPHRSTNFELYGKVVPGVLQAAVRFGKPCSLVLYGSDGSGKIHSFFGSGLNDSCLGGEAEECGEVSIISEPERSNVVTLTSNYYSLFTGFDHKGAPVQYPYDWGLLPRITLQLLNHVPLAVTALQYHRSTCYDVLNATSLTNFAYISRVEELTQLQIGSAEAALALMRRLLCACTHVDSEFPDKHKAPIVITLILDNGGRVITSLLPLKRMRMGRARSDSCSLRANIAGEYHALILDHMLPASCFVSLVLCLENAQESEKDIDATLRLGKRIGEWIGSDIESRRTSPLIVLHGKHILMHHKNKLQLSVNLQTSALEPSLCSSQLQVRLKCWTSPTSWLVKKRSWRRG